MSRCGVVLHFTPSKASARHGCRRRRGGAGSRNSSENFYDAIPSSAPTAQRGALTGFPNRQRTKARKIWNSNELSIREMAAREKFPERFHPPVLLTADYLNIYLKRGTFSLRGVHILSEIICHLCIACLLPMILHRVGQFILETVYTTLETIF
jgi:hypothetical protein